MFQLSTCTRPCVFFVFTCTDNSKSYTFTVWSFLFAQTRTWTWTSKQGQELEKRFLLGLFFESYDWLRGQSPKMTNCIACSWFSRETSGRGILEACKAWHELRRGWLSQKHFKPWFLLTTILSFLYKQKLLLLLDSRDHCIFWRPDVSL